MTNEPTLNTAQLDACSNTGLVAMLELSFESECALQDEVMCLASIGNSHFLKSNESAASLFSSINRILEPAEERYLMREVLTLLKARMEQLEPR